MRILPLFFGAFGLLLSAIIFGFFSVWSGSIMGGLDQLSPQESVAAMKAIVLSVSDSGKFNQLLTGAPICFALAAVCAWHLNMRPAIWSLFAAAALIYVTGVLMLTAQHHLPMNAELAFVTNSASQAARFWAEYAPEWQYWNIVRTAFVALAVCLAGVPVWFLSSRSTTAHIYT